MASITFPPPGAVVSAFAGVLPAMHFVETLAGRAFGGDYVLTYFFLDKKVPKNQGFRKKAKN